MNDRRIRFYSSRLPKAVHDYLDLVIQRGSTMPLGVFEPRAKAFDVAPRSLSVLLSIGGLLTLIALALSKVPTFEPTGALARFSELTEVSRWVGAAAFAALVAGLVLVIRRWWLRKRFPFPSPFVYLDGAHFWVVGRTFVDAHPVADSTGLHYAAPILKVFAPATQPVDVQFGDVRLIQIAGAFLQRMQQLYERTNSPRERAVQAWSSMCMDPALALQTLATFQMPERLSEEAVSEAVPLGRERVTAFKVASIVALAAAGFAAIALPFALGTMQHGVVLRNARAETSGLSGPRAYLERFPEGPNAAEMADELDNRWFSSALADSKAVRSTSPLEAYLADARNRIHREGAEEQIDELSFAWGKEDLENAESPVRLKEYLIDMPSGRFAADAKKLVEDFYAAAQTRLELAAAGAKDRSLVRALLGLVTLAGTRLDPTVTVGFKANVRLEGTDPDSIDAAPAFAPPIQQRREQLIVKLLAEAVSKVVSANVLVLAEAPDNMTPDVLVTYSIRPIRGQLRRYTDNNVYKGELQDYSIDWTIEFRGPRQYAYRARSAAVPSIRSTGQPNDPVWTPYAVTQYSAFYDMTLGLVEAAGLPAVERPTAFDTRDVL